VYDNSYLKLAGQMWKFYLFSLAFPLIGLALVYIVLNGMVGENVNLSLFLITSGLGLAIGGLVLAALTMNCPMRRTRLLWKAMKEQSSENWLHWLMSLGKCPVCQHSFRAARV
jgi:flagellar biosynthesis protein FliR